jgi:hypothetical protein
LPGFGKQGEDGGKLDGDSMTSSKRAIKAAVLSSPT